MKRLILSLFLTVCLAGALYAQKDTVVVDGYYETGGTVGTLNNAIESAQSDGSINNTVFKLKLYEAYVLNGVISIQEGEELEIVAPEPGTTQETAPPQIMWTDEDITRDYIIQSYGDVTLKNLWILYADLQGNQVSSSIQMEDQSGEDNTERIVAENVIFDYNGIGANSGGAVNVTSDHFVGIFKRCYFRNQTDTHFQYYGRAVSFPYQSSGWHIDSVLFENTTFANMGYVYMQEGNEFGDNVQFNHCTFLNIVMFTLESPWYYQMSITNSIFVNPFMLGFRQVDVCDEGEDFEAGECDDPNGGIFSTVPVDSFGFTEYVDFTDQDREILLSHTSYAYTDWLKDWMENNPYSQELRQQRLSDEIPMPQPYVTESTINFIDSTDAEGNDVFPKMTIDYETMYLDVLPGFNEPATNQDTLKTFMQYKWDNNADINWAYKPWTALNQVWPLPEDMSYTNETLMSAAMGDFPLGDLYHWYPEEYEEWKAQRESEWSRIDTWMETGQDPTTDVVEQPDAGVPAEFTLGQNYPNPFNPVTTIRYSVPQTGEIALKVYNNLGQEVATLYEGRRQAGEYVTEFNGSGLASGVYFYRLQTEDVSITRKFILMK